MNVYQFFNFSSLGSISQDRNTSWAMHRHYISQEKKTSWQEKKQYSATIKINWTKISFYNLTSFAYFFKEFRPPAVTYIPKVISDHTKNVKVHIILAPPVHHEIVFECKLSFNMLSAWVRHQIVNINIWGFS